MDANFAGRMLINILSTQWDPTFLHTHARTHAPTRTNIGDGKLQCSCRPKMDPNMPEICWKNTTTQYKLAREIRTPWKHKIKGEIRYFLHKNRMQTSIWNKDEIGFFADLFEITLVVAFLQAYTHNQEQVARCIDGGGTIVLTSISLDSKNPDRNHRNAG